MFHGGRIIIFAIGNCCHGWNASFSSHSSRGRTSCWLFHVFEFYGTIVVYSYKYFSGDGTGVGKGRQIAAIFADNFLKGRKKGIWFSVSNTLSKVLDYHFIYLINFSNYSLVGC